MAGAIISEYGYNWINVEVTLSNSFTPAYYKRIIILGRGWTINEDGSNFDETDEQKIYGIFESNYSYGTTVKFEISDHIYSDYQYSFTVYAQAQNGNYYRIGNTDTYRTQYTPITIDVYSDSKNFYVDVKSLGDLWTASAFINFYTYIDDTNLICADEIYLYNDGTYNHINARIPLTEEMTPTEHSLYKIYFKGYRDETINIEGFQQKVFKLKPSNENFNGKVGIWNNEKYYLQIDFESEIDYSCGYFEVLFYNSSGSFIQSRYIYSNGSYKWDSFSPGNYTVTVNCYVNGEKPCLTTKQYFPLPPTLRYNAFTASFKIEEKEASRPGYFYWTTAEKNAFTGKGATTELTAVRWNAFVDNINDILRYKGLTSARTESELYGVPKGTYMDDFVKNAKGESGGTFYANCFNIARHSIGAMNGTGILTKYSGDKVLGSEFITLQNKLNEVT